MMSRLVALALVASLGCTTYQGSKTTAKVGGLIFLGSGVVLAGTVAVVSRTDNCCGLASPALFLPIIPMGIGVWAGIFGLAGMAVHSGDDGPTAPDPVPGRIAPPNPDDDPQP